MNGPSQIPGIIADLEAFVNDRVRKLAYDMALELQEATPKDTHHAESNWIWGLSEKLWTAGSKKHVDFSAWRTGLTEVAAWTIHQGSLIMRNNVHYIGKVDQFGKRGLDAGSSPQAPAGFIGKTIRSVLRGAVAKSASGLGFFNSPLTP